MPFVSPGPADVHVDRPLTNIAIAYMQMADKFVAPKVFPVVPVANKSDTYWEIPREAWFSDEFKERGPGTETAGADYRLSQGNYNCDVWGLHKDVDDQSRANQDMPLDLDRQAVEFIMQKGMIRQEVNWGQNYFGAGVWNAEADGAATRSASFDPTDSSNNDLVCWNNSASTPIEDMRLMKEYVEEQTGYEPNVAVLSRKVYNVLVDHEDIIGRLDRGQTTGPAMAMRDSLAALFEVDEVLVMSGVQNTAGENLTASYDFIGGKNALVAYRAPNPGIYVPSAGYTFNWTGYAGSVPGGVEISRFRMEHLRSDRVEGEMAWDQKLIADSLGGFFNGIIQ